MTNTRHKQHKGRIPRVDKDTPRNNSWRRLALLFCLLLLFAGLNRAQTQSGAIRGQVTDPSGGALVGATVLLTTPSGDSLDTTTNKEGMYEFKGLAAGTYGIKAVASGFALFDKSGIALAAGQSLRVDIPYD